MIVEVLYFAEIKDITGKEKERFEIFHNLEELLQLLFKKYSALQTLLWDERSQKIHNVFSVIINNQAIHEKDPSLIQINDGDTVAFLLPVSGG
ncbi:hypothetical protein LCGC14_1420490 [marine sediment metagenome]|uniref:MoaD/ThiS family protein n=1 Tax=marine sediment metagenome TaxID=412755 RepID=A0A0F9M732_9ZZZZ|nr:MoaD/ThiS family protein [archaeon]